MLSNQRLSSRKSLYLITSRTGVFTFRWNLRVNGKHHQPTLSLKTRDYLQAVKLASEIAIRIQQITLPTLEDIKSIYSDFKGSQSKQALLLQSIDISNHLTDLSIKSQTEYRNCWNSFVSSLSQSTTLDSVRQSHIEQWKKTQTCSLTTMKKKLRLLSSCFGRVGHKVEQDWFKVAVEKTPVRPKRAITKQELGELLRATQSYKKSKDEWKYYLPRIAALTGCRLNEIAQLRVCDVKLRDEPTLSINDGHDDKKLKNSSSKRVLPVTTPLLNLLNELIAGKGKNEHLFTLPYSKQNGYAGKPSKYFSGLLKSLDIKDVSFHSLRHYVVTELFNAGVKEELIGSLMGHSVGKLTTGKIYLSGFSYNNKLKALDMLSVGFF
ncbi:recombinase [Vibrio parahaemolyticus]|uniref:site-specific integrase n=3 Tax=Vibrio parahaemolyticus TaxID=670 RepID=UPI000C86A597|nr:site-specific integrase [Vibrio parahaemolyticus]EGQ7808411.1 site-specific integrase [Vibrio parahaemolyticus]EJB8687443.1 site-specific integrase [Vibrio parahaemolyticus]PMS68733.1 recombinase [Vibrio parahaemolyticus]PMS83672.1 recombinase [Vibrio parahaemolyticus]PMT10909.1 recombinase [Vibrio parahaemolyticus]